MSLYRYIQELKKSKKRCSAQKIRKNHRDIDIVLGREKSVLVIVTVTCEQIFNPKMTFLNAKLHPSYSEGIT